MLVMMVDLFGHAESVALKKKQYNIMPSFPHLRHKEACPSRERVSPLSDWASRGRIVILQT
jgi:hypothetical protein